jgi:hypothetical protein
MIRIADHCLVPSVQFSSSMSIQTFPLDALNKVRRYVQSTLSPADTEQQSQTWTGLGAVDELPEPESIDDLSGIFAFGGQTLEDTSTPKKSWGHWFISTVNPGTTLLKLPGLRLKPEFRLVSYLYRSDEEGVGGIFAVPEWLSTTAYLEKALQVSGNLSQPPQPRGALAHFMDAVEGDRTAISFVMASLVRREFQEFGALGKRCNWSHHRLIDGIPPQAQCQWRLEHPPKDLAPKVKVSSDGQAAVEFFSYRSGSPIVLYRHLDQYAAGHYTPNCLDKAVAIIHR